MSNQDSDSFPKKSSAAAGRGRLLSMLNIQSSSGKNDTSSGCSPSPNPPKEEKPTTIGGRGKLVQMLQRGPISSKSRSASGSASGSASASTSDKQNEGTDTGPKSLESLTPSPPQPQLQQQTEPQSQPLPQTKTIGRGKLLQTLAQKQITQNVDVPPTSALVQLRLTEVPPPSDEIVEGAAGPQIEEVEEEEEAPFEARVGTAGEYIRGLSNYVRLKVDDNKGVFEYELRFTPSIHDVRLRFQLLMQHKSVIGETKTFDGSILCLPIRLPDKITTLTSVSANDSSTVVLQVIYKRQRKFSECHTLYGTLFNRIMKVLQFVRFGKKDFDPSEPKVIPQYKLEVWPGYVTAAEEFKGGVMLCLDVTHRVLSKETVYDKLLHAAQTAKRNNTDYKKLFTDAMLGTIVLTRYNNKTYRIDDVDFDITPQHTFKRNGVDVSYEQYYKEQYGITVKDLKQPMLVHREEVRVSGKEEKEERTFCILPELSYCTGLTDQMRADFNIMRDIATHTRITPNQRVEALNRFCYNVNSTPAAKSILSGWGLTLEDRATEFQYRQLNEEKVFFANNKGFLVGKNADFGKYATNNQLIDVIDLKNWVVMHTNKDTKQAKAFIDLMLRNARPMGIAVSEPKVILLPDDRNETYGKGLRDNLTSQTQIVVCICPTSRDDRYAAIKKICCAEVPIPSQVINARTLSNDAKNRSVVQKIALQMNCKLGGSLWKIKIPFENVMICGIDTYHEAANQSKSVSAFVASLNSDYTQWYSKAVIQNKREELVHGLGFSIQKALEAYRKKNAKLPEKIIIFRDGVGDGQLEICKEYELKQLKESCHSFEPNYDPKFTFIVVQKRVNTRIFMQGRNGSENPLPGSILDHSVTRRNLYDFYLVPQSVRQGTVTPTHFVVVDDQNNYDPDIIQRLSYKLCFLYYNWPGTVRVPACCQYAHKLSTLVGTSIKRETSEKLADKLFYL